jgi:zinc D-Ala-D-Ala carboxypeptidase
MPWPAEMRPRPAAWSPPIAALLAAVLALTACAGGPAVPTPTPSAVAELPSPTAAPRSTPRPAPRGPERLGEAPLARPAAPAQSVRFEAALVADHCVDRDLAAPPSRDIVLAVLDRTYALPAAYEPDDLVPASAAGLTGSSGTKLVRAVVLDDLAAMKSAWDAAGLSLIVESGYRSYASQVATFNSWVARVGYAETVVRSARPGHSEHQLGTAIDVTSPGWGGRFGDWARETAEGAWMAAHAWEYGFVMSYPWGSQASTCFSYEPWHYRWIGREAAAEHRASGLFLRQYLERHIGG